MNLTVSGAAEGDKDPGMHGRLLRGNRESSVTAPGAEPGARIGKDRRS